MTEVRAAFARLIAQGVSNSEACRIVGINRRTGATVPWRSCDSSEIAESVRSLCRSGSLVGGAQ